MIDWHSHILPAIDDGSRSVSESLQMLRMMGEQGVDTVVATPHFFANDESVDAFCERRENAYQKLKEAIESDDGFTEGNSVSAVEGSEKTSGGLKAPEIVLGAEVKYYNGISRLEDLKKLSIQNRNLLMIEMSMSRWTEYTVKEIVELAQNYRMKIIIAHIERYEAFQSFESMERLYESGVLMQVNSSFFSSFLRKQKAIRMLERGEIHLIGSDCHNLTTRPPELKKAFDYIEKKLGSDFVNQFNAYGKRVITPKYALNEVKK